MALGCPTWEKYLATKQQYGRTFLSYILKLGHAGDIEHQVARGISGSQLVEFAKACGYPEKISPLIEAKWEDVGHLSVRKMREALREHVAEHHDDFRKPGKPRWTRSRRTELKSLLNRRYKALNLKEDRAKFLQELRELLADVTDSVED